MEEVVVSRWETADTIALTVAQFSVHLAFGRAEALQRLLPASAALRSGMHAEEIRFQRSHIIILIRNYTEHVSGKLFFMAIEEKKSSQEPEDILEGVDKQVKPSLATKGKLSARSNTAPVVMAKSSPGIIMGNHRFGFVVGGVVALLVLVGVAGYLFFGKGDQGGLANQTANSNMSEANANQSGNNSNTSVAASNSNTAAPQGTASDTDGDGLSNTEESKAGTNPKLPDTDGDGLSDREEVEVWKTNPLNADTDKDGFKDGEEIQKGFDPKVAGGKLLDLQKAIQQLNANK